MKSKVKNIIKAIVFMALLVYAMIIANNILTAKLINGTRATYAIRGMYELEENSVDVCIVGTSQQVYGLSSMRMLDKYGISAYSCATGNQPVAASLFCIKELDKTQNLKLVLFDPGMVFKETKEGNYRTVLDQAKFSKNKMDAVKLMSKYNEGIEAWTYAFTLAKYHTRWSSVNKKDFVYNEIDNEEHRGNVLYSIVNRELTDEDFIIDEKSGDVESGYTETVIDGEDREALDEMVAYCRDNDIELVLIKQPHVSWTKDMSKACEEYAEANDIPYIDFGYSDLYNEVGFDVEHDFMNGNHLNVRGCDKYTDYISEYLLENYELQNHTAVNDDEMKLFRKIHDRKYFESSIELSQFADIYNEGSYEMLVKMSDDVTSSLSEEDKDILKKMGINIDSDRLSGKNYAAYINGTTCFDEQISEEPIEYTGKFSDGKSFKIYSDLNTAIDENKDVVAGEAIIYKKAGLNITVYDKETASVIDYMTIYYDEASGRTEIYHNPDKLSLDKN